MRQQTIRRVDIGTSENNHVAGVFHVDDLDEYMKILESPETADAMENDGVKRDTVTVFALDRRFDP